MLITALLSLSLSAAPKLDDKLVGTWLAGGEAFITLNANGTGTMEDGKVKWSADGKTLVVTDEDGESDRLSYTVSGGNLTINLGGMPMTLTRAGAGVQVKKQGPIGAKLDKRGNAEDADREAMAEAQAWLQKNGQAAPQKTQPGQAPPRAAGNDQLSKLLLSSAWCSFTYNQHTGTSSSTRYQFYPDGTWSTGGRTETYNSGANGTVAGQYDSNSRGRWESRGGQLFMSTPDSPMLQVVPGFSVTRNSNGYPIINADGREFSSCN